MTFDWHGRDSDDDGDGDGKDDDGDGDGDGVDGDKKGLPIIHRRGSMSMEEYDTPNIR